MLTMLQTTAAILQVLRSTTNALTKQFLLFAALLL